jgi:adenylate cyclase
MEASVMITDLEGFTPLSEQLDNPELVSQVLTKYFTQTTGHILESDGTIINFVADAICAVWGAPLADRDHARKAALAAWRLHQSSAIEVGGHALRTRVGVHTGRVLAGNIGSAQRFDYAVIGDTVNFASRLEGLNKYFGTNILISDALLQKLGDHFVTRRLGEFRVVGKSDARIVYELLGPAPHAEPMPWIETFARGLDAFRRRDWGDAERRMRETISQHGGTDGPAAFYLTEIASRRGKVLPPDWNGVVDLATK